MNPAVVKWLIRLALSMTDDESRKKMLGLVIGIPVGLILLMALTFETITSTSISDLNRMFSTGAMEFVMGIRDRNGFDEEQNFGDDYYGGELVQNGAYTYPVTITCRVSQRFGPRIHPVTFKKQFHCGVDLAVPSGTQIHPFMDGTVIFAGVSGDIKRKKGYGYLLIIDHGNGITTKYAHLTRFNCRKGDKVTAGQIVAYSGNTGISTGPHLHFEVCVNNKPVNPMRFFEDEKEEKDPPPVTPVPTTKPVKPTKPIKKK